MCQFANLPAAAQVGKLPHWHIGKLLRILVVMWSKPSFVPLAGAPVKQLAVYDTGNVHSDTQASKPVLFFLHGLATGSIMWKYAIEHLRHDYRCIAVDLPGHGNSWNERGSFTMTFYAQAVRACIEALKLEEVTLIGHSMGGQIAIIMALQVPAVVQQVVLVSAAGIETFNTDEAMKIVQGAELFYRAPLDIAHVVSIYQPHLTVRSELARELAEEHIRLQNEHFAVFSETVIRSVKGMLSEPVFNFLPHIHQPALVLYGENDQLIPNKWVHPLMNMQEIAQRAKNRIHNSKVEVLPGCGHYLPFEVPKDFADRVNHFWVKTDK